MKQILIVEDDLEISSLLAGFLEDNGYKTTVLHDGLHAAACLKTQAADLVLLDLMLPFKSGDSVLADIRSYSTVPVLVISAKETTQNKIDLLRLGADDYITKPFDLEEVLARIESHLRRVRFAQEPKRCLKSGALVLDIEKNKVSVHGWELKLTAKEFEILKLLLEYPDKIFSKANLFMSVWHIEYMSEDNTLNVHISNLRNKLKEVSPDEEYIDTVWGIGYRLHKAKT